jgi:hypothetical protein
MGNYSVFSIALITKYRLNLSISFISVVHIQKNAAVGIASVTI